MLKTAFNALNEGNFIEGYDFLESYWQDNLYKKENYEIELIIFNYTINYLKINYVEKLSNISEEKIARFFENNYNTILSKWTEINIFLNKKTSTNYQKHEKIRFFNRKLKENELDYSDLRKKKGISKKEAEILKKITNERGRMIMLLSQQIGLTDLEVKNNIKPFYEIEHNNIRTLKHRLVKKIKEILSKNK